MMLGASMELLLGNCAFLWQCNPRRIGEGERDREGEKRKENLN